MRNLDNNRVEGFVKKHIFLKRWISVMLVVALLVTCTTMYALNKAASAVSEETAEDVGMVLTGEGSEEGTEEAGVTNEEESTENATPVENSEEGESSEENASASSEEAESANTSEEASAGSETGASETENVENTENSETSNEGESTEETAVTEEVNASTEGESTEENVAGEEAVTEEQTENTEDNSLLASNNDIELTEDVVLTVSYVNEAGEKIADEKEINLSESLDFTTEAPKQEGYEFVNAAIDGTVITKIVAKKDANDHKYYEVTAEDETVVSIKENKTVVLTYALVVESDITLTAKYVDKDGAELREATKLNIGEELGISKKENVEAIENYFYIGAAYNNQKITSIKAVLGENAAVSDGNAAEGANKASSYELTTKDGQIITVNEDAEIILTYYKASTETEFTYSDDKVTVVATMNSQGIFPEGIELCVTEINAKTEGYNYDAYLKAMNDNADKIADRNEEEKAQTFDETNTLLYDIAFKLDGVEYQPEAGAVTVSMKLNEKPISEDNGFVKPEDVSIVHLPISEAVMENVDATSEATDFTAEDVKVEVLDEKENNVEVEFEEESDNVSFDSGSFSTYALVYLWGNIISWEGTNTMSADEIVRSLGDSTMFGAVADTYEGSGDADIEANIAVNHLKKIIDFGNSSEVYTHVSYDGYNITKYSTKPGVFYFGLYSEEYTKKNTNPKNIGYFGINVTGQSETVSLLDAFSKETLKSYGRFYVYEIDPASGNIVPNGGTFKSNNTEFTVTYDSNAFVTESDKDIVRTFSTSFVESNETGTNLYDALKTIDGNTVVVKNRDGSYTEYSFPNNSKGKTYEGKVYKASELLDTAKNVSKQLALLKSSDDVIVINAIGTSDGFRKDVTKAYKNTLDEDTVNNYLTRYGIDLGNKLLVINLDLTLCGGNYDITQFAVRDAAGNIIPTGQGWNEIANQIIINPLQRDSNNNLLPYQGTLSLNTVSGTFLAPEAKVIIDNGAVPGAVIANYIYQKKEIHKLTVRKRLNEEASIGINNVHDSATGNLRIHKMVVNEFGEKQVREDRNSAILQNVYFKLQREGDDSYIWFRGFVGSAGKEDYAYEYTSKHKPKKDKKTKQDIKYRVVYNDSAQWTIFDLPAGTYTVTEVGDGLTFEYDPSNDSITVKQDAELTRVTHYAVTVDSEGGKYMGDGGNNFRAVFSSNVQNKSYNPPENVHVGGATETVQISNYYSPPFAPIRATKNLLGGNWLDDMEFTFEITPMGYNITNSEGMPYSNSDPQPMPEHNTVTVGKDKQTNGVAIADFGNILYRYEGTYKYKITEQKGDASGVDYDTKAYYVVVVVGKKDTYFTKSYTYSKLANPGIPNSTNQTEEFHYLGADVYYYLDENCTQLVETCEVYLGTNPKTGALDTSAYKVRCSNATSKVVFNNTAYGTLTVKKEWIKPESNDGEVIPKEITAYIKQRIAGNNNGWKVYKTIQLTDKNGWTWNEERLPIIDAQGNTYEYTVEEEAYDTYDISYKYNNNSVQPGFVMSLGDGNSYGNATITNRILVVNVLPSSGGMGTVPFMIIGIVMITAAAGALLFGRRKKD
ncbi:MULTISPECIES: Spy0128 family protein [unclassified Butyrivibrio]|uniref:Spy0128 family protein n=1 Tax=unclassified Butyrivibrio TaxID=2639466 RepID=UPI0003B562FA|nr:MULTISPECIES: FctA domain-containing protein [unclassified Butyrivibrio]